jgi:DNA topoisomerase I
MLSKKTVQAKKRSFKVLKLAKNLIKETTQTETTGQEKAKLFPTDIGILVNKFLVQYFDSIIDYNFTANVEKEFDEIAEGRKVWNDMIKEFYGPFHNKIVNTTENAGKFSGEKFLGIDPESGKNVFVKVGSFGPMVQIGDTESEEKPRFSGLRKDQSMEEISLEEALKLFEYPRNIGKFEEKDVTVAVGRFGPYVKHNSQFFSLAKTDDAATIDLDRAIELIEGKRTKEAQSVIREFEKEPGLKVLNGRYGPYISFNKNNLQNSERNRSGKFKF